jgi:hypothetical protein
MIYANPMVSTTGMMASKTRLLKVNTSCMLNKEAPALTMEKPTWKGERIAKNNMATKTAMLLPHPKGFTPNTYVK